MRLLQGVGNGTEAAGLLDEARSLAAQLENSFNALDKAQAAKLAALQAFLRRPQH